MTKSKKGLLNECFLWFKQLLLELTTLCCPRPEARAAGAERPRPGGGVRILHPRHHQPRPRPGLPRHAGDGDDDDDDDRDDDDDDDDDLAPGDRLLPPDPPPAPGHPLLGAV